MTIEINVKKIANYILTNYGKCVRIKITENVLYIKQIKINRRMSQCRGIF